MPNENKFPAWLRAALNGRPNVFLVRNSGEKENGRPVIDDSRVSKWLKGDQRPSMELASLAARVLGGSEAEAIRAAGYTYGLSLERIEKIKREFPTPRKGFLITEEQIGRLHAVASEIEAVLSEIKKGGAGDGDTLAQKNPNDGVGPGGLSAIPALNEQEVSDGDETLPVAADDVTPDDDEEPGGSR